MSTARTQQGLQRGILSFLLGFIAFAALDKRPAKFSGELPQTVHLIRDSR